MPDAAASTLAAMVAEAVAVVVAVDAVALAAKVSVMSVMTDGAAMAGSEGELFEWSKSFVVPEDNWIPWGFNTLKAEVRAVVYETDEICHASSGEPYATIWANYPPPAIKDEIDLKAR